MKVIVCPSCGYWEETKADRAIAMPRHPPAGRVCPDSGTPVQPMLRSRPVSAAQMKLYQQLNVLHDKMIAAQRAQAAAYRDLDELRTEAAAVVEQLRNTK